MSPLYVYGCVYKFAQTYWEDNVHIYVYIYMYIYTYIKFYLKKTGIFANEVTNEGLISKYQTGCAVVYQKNNSV